MYKLKTRQTPHQEFVLTTGAYRLGSAWDSEIVIQDESVSEYHCEIVVTAKMLTVRDLTGKGETYVDGQSVQNMRLQPGQTLRLGAVSLTLEESASDVAAAVGGGRSGAGTAAANRKRSRLMESIGVPLLILVALAAIASILYVSRSAFRGSDRSGVAPGAQPGHPGAPEPGGPPSGADPDSGALHVRPGAAPTVGSPAAAIERQRAMDAEFENAAALVGKGEAEKAASVLEHLLKEQQSALGAEHPKVLRTLETLGELYKRRRQYTKAEPHLRQAVAAVTKIKGPEDPQTADALNELGELHLASGQYAKAAAPLEQALKIREATLPAEDPELGSSLNNVAALRIAEGNYTNAAPLLDKALRIFSAVEPSNPMLGEFSHNAGELHRKMGDLARAEPLLEQALKQKEQQLSANDPSLRATVESLAALHRAKGDYEKAEPYFQRALKIAERTHGPSHPETAKSLSALAALYDRMGQPEKAAPLHERARQAIEETNGPEHLKAAEILDQRASGTICQGDEKAGIELAAQSLRAKRRLLEAMIACGSEEHRLAHRDRLKPYTLAVALGSPPEIAESVVRFKGVIVDSLIEDRLLAMAGNDPELRVQVDLLQETKGQLAQILFDTPSDLTAEARAQRLAEKKSLLSKLELFEAEVADAIPGYGRARRALTVTVEQVQQAIPSGAILVEFARYSRCVGTNHWEPSYGAVVLPPTGGVHWVPLGSADAIEQNIERYQHELQRPIADAERGSSGSGDSGTAPGDSLAGLLKTMHGQLWVPLESKIPAGTHTIIVSPDSALGFVSFGTLLTPDDRFFGEMYSIRVVSTGRDLLPAQLRRADGPVLLMGNPDLSQATGSGVSAQVTERIGNSDRRALLRIQLPPLSGAADETAQLELLVKSWDWPVVSSVGAKASESSLGAVVNPRMVHLAARAFFLAKSAEEVEDPRGPATDAFDAARFSDPPESGDSMPDFGTLFSGLSALRNPLHQCGVALAGAGAALKQWDEDPSRHLASDGLVTGAELGVLKLAGTRLVVISSANSGVGLVRSGEALLAMRRAFVQAGAENLLLTLRSEANPEGARFLAELYSRLRNHVDTAETFAEVQRDWLIRLRNDRGLGAAVRAVGPFIMNSRTL